jgi:PhzF family phenazine biosynthesis protein
MSSYAYRIVNVFTRGRTALSGNPLCVFERAQGLDEVRMQALALQFNLSETSFILPSQHATAAVRIFTPRYEMPFAGHPTLGTAHVCRSLGLGGDELTLEMPAGIIAVRAAGDRWTLSPRPPRWRELPGPRSELAAALGLTAGEIGERPLWVDAGAEQLMVPLASEAAVRRVQVRTELFAALAGAGAHAQAYVFAPTAAGLLARFFFVQGASVLEDPATGSAAANLGGWCQALKRPLPCELEIAQGEYTGRPSVLRLGVEADGEIRVSGEVIELGRGTISL